MGGLHKHHCGTGLSFRRNRTSPLSPPRPAHTSYLLFPPPKGAELLMGDPFVTFACSPELEVIECNYDQRMPNATTRDRTPPDTRAVHDVQGEQPEDQVANAKRPEDRLDGGPLGVRADPAAARQRRGDEEGHAREHAPGGDGASDVAGAHGAATRRPPRRR